LAHPKPEPRIVCVGSNEESKVALEGLVQAGAAIVGVVTWPAGARSGISDYVDLHPLCAKHGIPCIDTEDINQPDTVDAIRGLQPDHVFVLGWSQLLGNDAIDVPHRYVVGSHPTPLPHGRGRAPVPWMILLGDRRGAVSLFRMVRGADAGPLLLQRWFDIAPDVNATTLYRQVAETLRDAFCELYGRLAEGSVLETPQDEEQASYRARRVPGDGLIDFQGSRDAVDRLVRAVTHPYPGAYTYYRGRKVVVWRSSLEDVPDHRGVTGQILARRDGRLLVQAADGPLWLEDLTQDGDPIDPTDLAIGEKLGYRVEDEIHALRREVAEMKARLERS
jgi:methionyl-tRNA formyltransferase